MPPVAPARPREKSLFSSALRFIPHAVRVLPNSAWTPSRVLEQRAAKNANDLALAYLERRYTWREVDELANRHAQFFQREGIRPGEVVALMMDNRPDFLFILHGLTKVGAVAALINTNLTDASLAHAIRISKAKHILAGAEHALAVAAAREELEGPLHEDEMWVQVGGETSSAEHLPERSRVIDEDVEALPTAKPDVDHTPKASDLFCYIFTSGTTGLPKAAVISHARMMGANSSMGLMLIRGEPGDVIYVTLPLYHSSALFLGWGAALASGAGIALRKKFSASNFWSDVRSFNATAFIYIGELCRYLLNSPVQSGERDHQLRLGVGNGLRPDIWEDFQERFNVPLMREFYGATEGNAALVNMEGRPGMVGKLSLGMKLLRCDAETGELLRNAAGFCESIAIGETGLLVGRINSIVRFDGYADQKATQKKILCDVLKKGDRYFNTGDLLELHEGRWLSFADRVGDTFRWKGENVSTNEVAEDPERGSPGCTRNERLRRGGPQSSEGRAGMASTRHLRRRLRSSTAFGEVCGCENLAGLPAAHLPAPAQRETCGSTVNLQAPEGRLPAVRATIPSKVERPPLPARRRSLRPGRCGAAPGPRRRQHQSWLRRRHGASHATRRLRRWTPARAGAHCGRSLMRPTHRG